MSLIDYTNKIFDTLCKQLESSLFQSQELTLSRENIPDGSGVYILMFSNEIVYVGKATKFSSRLRKHARTVKDASLINEEQITFKTLPLSKNLMTGFEDYLIDTFQPSWNSSGFGSNAHGKGRSNQKNSIWNEKYGRMVTR